MNNASLVGYILLPSVELTNILLSDKEDNGLIESKQSDIMVIKSS
jgi:hypothetical protein